MTRRAPYPTVPTSEHAPPIWRSLEERSESEAVRKKHAEAEFPEGVAPTEDTSGLLDSAALLSRRNSWPGVV